MLCLKRSVNTFIIINKMPFNELFYIHSRKAMFVKLLKGKKLS